MFGHQRNIIFFLLFALSVAFSAKAQDSTSYWKFKSLYSLNGTQTSFVNWNAGGRNNISLIGSAAASAGLQGPFLGRGHLACLFSFAATRIAL
jgi:hypothetical protein